MLNNVDRMNQHNFKRSDNMQGNLKNLIPISILATISICLVLLKNIVQEFNEYYGYYDIGLFILVQFILTFNIYLTFKLNSGGR